MVGLFHFHHAYTGLIIATAGFFVLLNKSIGPITAYMSNLVIAELSILVGFVVFLHDALIHLRNYLRGKRGRTGNLLKN
ncbi:MAG: hypothetical protein ACE5KO_03245 [Candidatus Bathyarchaeia archaeon]